MALPNRKDRSYLVDGDKVYVKAETSGFGGKEYRECIYTDPPALGIDNKGIYRISCGDQFSPKTGVRTEEFTRDEIKTEADIQQAFPQYRDNKRFSTTGEEFRVITDTSVRPLLGHMDLYPNTRERKLKDWREKWARTHPQSGASRRNRRRRQNKNKSRRRYTRRR